MRRARSQPAVAPTAPAPDRAQVPAAASNRLFWLVSGGVLVATLGVLPLSGARFGATVSFVPAMLAVVACFDAMTAYLLMGDYRDRGDPRVLATSWAYVWSLVTMVGYALAFPGVVAADPPLAVTPSMAPWFYLAWHAGFPLLLGLAWAPWPRWAQASTSVLRRARTARTGLAAATLVTGLVVVLMTVHAERLPVLIVGLDTTRMTTLTAPVVLPLVLLGLCAALRGTAGRSGPERWVPVTLLACLCDLTLTYASRFRYSGGWYAGRTMTAVSAAIVLFAAVGALRRAKARAEYEATTDRLTGLPNRRSADEHLDVMLARARRSGASLSVVGFDIDLFKAINDRYGHARGDHVLAAVATAVRRTLRRGDVAACTGGEEFLLLLPDTDLKGAAVVAERLRAEVASTTFVTDAPVTVSLGVGTLASGESAEQLLARVDAAMYEAKRSGRDRAVLCDPRPAGHAR